MKFEFGPKDFPPTQKAAKIAEKILRQYEIQGLHGVHSITAVEFYLSAPHYCDSANHCHPLQLKSGKWYIHTFKNHHSLKAPRYSGIDLTCGNAKNEIHAGILIRQLDGEGGSGLAIMKLMRGSKAKFGHAVKGDKRLSWSQKEKDFLLNLQGQDAFKASIYLKKRSTKAQGIIVAK